MEIEAAALAPTTYIAELIRHCGETRRASLYLRVASRDLLGDLRGPAEPPDTTGEWRSRREGDGSTDDQVVRR